MRDFLNNLHPIRAISPVSVADNTAQVGQIVDRQGYDGLTFVIATGSIADADATFTVLVEEGNDSGLSDAAAVADADLLGTEALAGFQFDDDADHPGADAVGDYVHAGICLSPRVRRCLGIQQHHGERNPAVERQPESLPVD